MTPPSAPKKLSVVVPCYNEEGNVRRFPKELFGTLDSFGLHCEFILVDDGSRDGTPQALKELSRSRPDVIYVAHPTNQGMGAALRTGFGLSSGDAILTLDADLTFHPKETPKLLAVYADDIQAVSGSGHLGELKGVSIGRRVLSRGVNILYRLLLGEPITAASSVFRLYRSSALKSLSLTAHSFDINAEILFKLVQGGGRICEVPVTLTRRQWGRSKISLAKEVTNHFKIFWKIILWRLGPKR